MTAYKVLLNGESCHGGTLAWSLPNGKPGEWHEVAGPIAACSNGLHLTTTPINWWKAGARAYEAEYEGDTDTMVDKIAVRRARLLREVDWDQFQVFSSGEHSVSAGRARAFDSATVRASGSATVRAFGSATVEAFDSATVRAFGSATAIRTRRHNGGWIKLSDLAAVVDRRQDGTVTLHAAPWSDAPDDLPAEAPR